MEIFSISLQLLCESIQCYGSNDVEIVISDNASEDDINHIFMYWKKKYPSIEMRYYRNEINIGMGRNFLNVVDLARGQFCWVVGGDDFLIHHSITNIIQLIKENPEVDFISCNFYHININDIDFIDKLNLKKQNFIKTKIKSPIIKVKDLIKPEYNNVFLGSIMSNVFRKEIWDSYNKIKLLEYEGFDSLSSMYPHCVIFAHKFLDKNALRIDDLLIIAGSGKRDWSTDSGLLWRMSSLPLIYYSILTQMAMMYKDHGLSQKDYNECMSVISKWAGRIFLPIVYYRYLKRKNVNGFDLMQFPKMTKIYMRYKNFYIGIIASVVKPLRTHWR
jgi:hypothetical protein